MRKLLLILFLGIFACSDSYISDMYKELEAVKIDDTLAIKERNNVIVVKVDSQKSFDNLIYTIESCLKKGFDKIQVNVAKGDYYFKEDHIKIAYRKDFRNVSITFNGEGANIISAGKDYRNAQRYEGNYDCESSMMYGKEDVVCWTKMSFSSTPVEVVDEQSGLCRMVCDGTKVSSDSFVFLTECYMTKKYKAVKNEGKYIYFIADDLQYVPSYKTMNVNMDAAYTNYYPRYKFANVKEKNIPYISNNKIHLPKRYKSVHECHSTSFLTIVDSEIGSISLKGLNFYGNRQEKYNALLKFETCSTEGIFVENCTFNNIRSNVILVDGTANVKISGCVFKKCYMECVNATNTSSKVFVENNSFDSCGCYCTNSAAVRVIGDNFLVSGNKFYDFGYCAIFTGVHYKADKKGKSFGVIENNDIRNSDDYISNKDQNSLMDGGAIYIFSFNDGTIVRRNEIHNYGGLWFTHGIYCDGGASGFRIYDNNISGIVNGEGIHCSKTPQLEKEEGSKMEKANDNYLIINNCIDGDFKERII